MMRERLLLLAADALHRVAAIPPLPAQPQLLAVADGYALLRTTSGTCEIPWEDLPAPVDLAPLIDHTLLKPEATGEAIDRLCDEARTHGFASVCVNGLWVSRATQRLRGSSVRVCTVVGFPLGAVPPEVKVFEAQEAIRRGAQEIDMVLSVGAAKGGDWEAVRRDLESMRAVTRGHVLKVILETCLLNEEEKRRACNLAAQTGCDFVKTSTGFSSGGATESDVALMRHAVGIRCGVKASGGIRSHADALRMVRAGATRLGVSSSLAVVSGGEGQGSY